MTNKFPIGSQWKARAGHRAVVVRTHDDGSFYAFHDIVSIDGIFDKIYGHYKDGSYAGSYPEYNLLAPWTEPRKGTVWVVINKFGQGECLEHDEHAKRIAEAIDAIALVEVNWTEGQGL